MNDDSRTIDLIAAHADALEKAISDLEERKRAAAEMAARNAPQAERLRLLSARLDALSQHERREVLDAIGLPRVSAAPRPLEPVTGCSQAKTAEEQLSPRLNLRPQVERETVSAIEMEVRAETADEWRIIGGRRLWPLAEAARRLSAMAGFGVPERDFLKSAYEAGERGELKFRDLTAGALRRGDNLSSFHGEHLFASDLNSWLEVLGFAPGFRLTDEQKLTDCEISAESEKPQRALQRSRAQDIAIVQALERLGHNVKALPHRKPGKPGVKSDVRKGLLQARDLFVSVKVFDRAWQRLLTNGDIQEATDSS